MIAALSGKAQAQSVAASVTQTNQKPESSLPSGIATPNKGSGGMLGVYIGDINEERARELKLPEARGAVIGKVEEGSPAAKAGLQENDVILAFNDYQIYNPTQLYRLLTESSAGLVVTFGISRGGIPQNMRIVLGQSRSDRRSEKENYYATADAYLAAANERTKEAEEAKRRGDEKEAARLEGEVRDFRRLSDDSRALVDKDISEGRVQPAVAARRSSNNVTAARYQLGIRATSLNEQLAAFFNVRGGVLVNEVRVGGIAESSG
ncbi:MAG: S1C family serine protease, partial [Blastocatellia bacterium]